MYEGNNYNHLLSLSSNISSQKPYLEGGPFSFFSFSTLARAETVSAKNKTYVPAGLWERGASGVLFWEMGEDGEDLAQRETLRVDPERGMVGGRAVRSRQEGELQSGS